MTSKSLKIGRKFILKKKKKNPPVEVRITVGNMIPEVKNYFTT